ncbi:hypothetical protein [Flavihumibacter sp. UBA7668]|uniref:hypothetical protein n=1 Tax=Flavihumibacter sp. UBA7668 TaxID=1946542 RepID=UPI0025BF5CD3|nr:hypothetical protein [Flavihumibacter sp. UBA7668]
MKSSFLFCLLGTLITSSIFGQDYSKLGKLTKKEFNVYYSKGYESKATTIANRVHLAYQYYHQLLSFQPDVDVLVLNENDWARYSNQKLVYGMPHYDDKKTLIVAAHDNPFWKSFHPERSMEDFFELLALHELAHAFHMQAAIQLQRKWMAELYCNLLLHTYIAEKEPESLPALTTFPKMVIAAGTSEYPYTGLDELENNYEKIGREFPKNYGWYQSNWHAAAGKFYDEKGPLFAQKIWIACQQQPNRLADPAWKNWLRSNDLLPILKMMESWPDFGP